MAYVLAMVHLCCPFLTEGPMHPKISDIQTSTLLYYDPEFHEECLQFCVQRDIDYLPSLDDPRCAYHRNDNMDGFTEVQIGYRQKVDDQVPIFDPRLYAQFTDHPLLFVYSSEDLAGVVHFSDYNRPAVSSHLYELLFDYEIALREFLASNKVTDSKMYEYFEEGAVLPTKQQGYFKGRLQWYRKNESLIGKGQPFEHYYLKDLVNYICDHNLLSLDKCVPDLRNGVMHARPNVQRHGRLMGNAVYDRKLFAEFFQACLALHRDLKRVGNRIAFMSGGSADPVVLQRSTPSPD